MWFSRNNRSSMWAQDSALCNVYGDYANSIWQHKELNPNSCNYIDGNMPRHRLPKNSWNFQNSCRFWTWKVLIIQTRISSENSDLRLGKTWAFHQTFTDNFDTINISKQLTLKLDVAWVKYVMKSHVLQTSVMHDSLTYITHTTNIFHRERKREKFKNKEQNGV